MKSGLEYFPLDCNMDDKLELIEAEFGITGFGVVVKLFQKIYGGKVTTLNGQTRLHYCLAAELVWVVVSFLK